jgi:hypothetical protein
MLLALVVSGIVICTVVLVGVLGYLIDRSDDQPKGAPSEHPQSEQQ